MSTRRGPGDPTRCTVCGVWCIPVDGLCRPCRSVIYREAAARDMTLARLRTQQATHRGDLEDALPGTGRGTRTTRNPAATHSPPWGGHPSTHTPTRPTGE